MKAETLTHWDMAENMKTEENYAAYLETALEEGDPAFISAVLGDIARSKGMTQMAKETGLARESLYRALSADGNTSFATVVKVINVLGLKMRIEAART
jgi:probable addiction module antidote protein